MEDEIFHNSAEAKEDSKVQTQQTRRFVYTIIVILFVALHDRRDYISVRNRDTLGRHMTQTDITNLSDTVLYTYTRTTRTITSRRTTKTKVDKCQRKADGDHIHTGRTPGSWLDEPAMSMSIWTSCTGVSVIHSESAVCHAMRSA